MSTMFHCIICALALCAAGAIEVIPCPESFITAWRIPPEVSFP